MSGLIHPKECLVLEKLLLENAVSECFGIPQLLLCLEVLSKVFEGFDQQTVDFLTKILN